MCQVGIIKVVVFFNAFLVLSSSVCVCVCVCVYACVCVFLQAMFVDLRPYMDTSAFITHESASVSRCHKQLRTLGLRHLVVIDSSYSVVGIVTRRDVTDKVLRSQWESQGEHIKVYVNVDPLPAAVAYVEDEDATTDSPVKKSTAGLDYGYSSSDGSGSGSEDGDRMEEGITLMKVGGGGGSGEKKESRTSISTVLDEEEY